MIIYMTFLCINCIESEIDTGTRLTFWGRLNLPAGMWAYEHVCWHRSLWLYHASSKVTFPEGNLGKMTTLISYIFLFTFLTKIQLFQFIRTYWQNKLLYLFTNKKLFIHLKSSNYTAQTVLHGVNFICKRRKAKLLNIIFFSLWK